MGLVHIDLFTWAEASNPRKRCSPNDEGDHGRAVELIAAIPDMFVTPAPLVSVLLHYRDRARENLDPSIRQQHIDAGRNMTVDEAVDRELARWATPVPQ